MTFRIASLLAVGLAVAVASLLALYLWDMRRAYGRIAGRSVVVASPYGQIEYTEHGSGPAVLVIHGSGGGYDQGELVAQAVLGAGFRAITPSRFGYLGSTFRHGATFDDQAHVYAHLLNTLGIKRVAVVALSHGGPSALLFALLYPERVSSLTLLSCGVAASAAQNQTAANQKGDMLMTIFTYDAAYWAIARFFKRQLMELMGADSATIASLRPAERKLVEQLIDFMNPVSPRSAGARFDNKATMPNERIVGIRAPTLILHATDDLLQLYHNAEFAASRIPNARLVAFRRGGHLLISVEQAQIRAATTEHIRAHAER